MSLFNFHFMPFARTAFRKISILKAIGFFASKLETLIKWSVTCRQIHLIGLGGLLLLFLTELSIFLLFFAKS